MDELQTGIEMSLAVFPQSPVFVQPSKASFNHPPLGNDCEFVQFTAPGNLHRHMPITQCFSHALRKRLARVAAVGQHTLNPTQARLAPACRL